MAMYIAVVVNIFGHLAQDSCSFLLKMLKALVQCTIEGEREINKHNEYLINKIPQTIQTTRRKFELEPNLQIFATCPSCCTIYEPVKDLDSGILIYLPRCGHRHWETSNPCNAQLTKIKVENGESIRSPILPFVYQPLSEFEGWFLSRPEIEEALQLSRKVWVAQEMWDIREAKGMWEIIGVDGKEFLDGPEDEIRLIWS